MPESSIALHPSLTTNGQRHRCFIHRLVPKSSRDRLLMCAVVDRIPAFLARMESDNPPEVVQRYIHTHWIAGSQIVAVWAAEAESGRVVGHHISMIESSWGVPYAIMIQTEIDRPYVSTIEQRTTLFDEIDQWAASQGARKIKAFTSHNTQSFARHTGFTLDKVIMVRTVGTQCSG